MDLERIREQLDGCDQLPPVDQWDPEYCGELDLFIKSDGQWLLDNTPLLRRPLQLLFSTIIKKEKDKFFLVTPVEKLGINVEWQPFVIVDFDWQQSDSGYRYLQLLDNCDNTYSLNNAEKWQLTEFNGVTLPIINCRRNLWASFSRACYYRLVEQATFSDTPDQSQASIESNQIVFSLGKI